MNALTTLFISAVIRAQITKGIHLSKGDIAD
jgi:hypothetical protein